MLFSLRRTNEEARCRELVLGAVPRRGHRHPGGARHEAGRRGAARGRGRRRAAFARRERAGEPPPDQQHHLRERGRARMARDVPDVQDEEGGALLHREPAQARAQGQPGGLHHAVGGRVQRHLAQVRPSGGRRGPGLTRRRPAPGRHRGRRCVSAARRRRRGPHTAGRALLPRRRGDVYKRQGKSFSASRISSSDFM